jgi:dienelactone hydrolase
MAKHSIRFLTCIACLSLFESSFADQSVLITIESEGWELIGNLQTPSTLGKVPVVLLLNQAAGTRHEYEYLAQQLADRGIGSLRLDLRGHGDSTNLDRFVPEESDEQARKVMIWSAEADVIAAHQFLLSHPQIDPARIAIVGASYSGEEMAEAGRKGVYAQAYVGLSPGSFSEESIADMDSSGVSWLFVVSRQERFLKDITARVRSTTDSVEIVSVPGSEHATGILTSRPDVAESIAVWLAAKL